MKIEDIRMLSRFHPQKLILVNLMLQIILDLLTLMNEQM